MPSDLRDDITTLRQTMLTLKTRGTALTIAEQLTILDAITDSLTRLAIWTGSIMQQPDKERRVL